MGALYCTSSETAERSNNFTVCTDQWLVTHVDPSWPVSQLKQILIQRFSRERTTVEKNRRTIPVSPHKTRRRSLSPITFAAPRKPRPIVAENVPSDASVEGPEAAEETEELDSDEEDDEVVDVNKALSEAHRYKYNTRPSTSSTSDTVSRLPPLDSSRASPEAEGCVLITFSTTQILEDRFSLDWYDIHPGELLELHPLAHSFVSLPRFSLDAYIVPYFAARVWALRVVGNALDSTLRDLGVARDHQTDDEMPDASPRSPLLRDKKKKITLEWKERWAVVHQGIFSLCKERHDTHAAFSAPLSTMLAIRDSTHFDLPLRSSRRTRSLPTPGLSSSGPDVICVKFLDASTTPPRQRTMSHDSLSVPFERNSSEASSPPTQNAWWRRGARDPSMTLSSSLASSASALMGSPSGSGLAEMWDALARRGSRSGLDDSECEGEEAVWIVLDMLTSAVTPARPPPLRIDTLVAEHGVPYPDWRLAITRKARRAGLGAVGRAMELVMFGDEECSEDEEDDEDELEIEWARRLSALEASPLEYPPRSRSRPRPGRHVSDSAVPSSVDLDVGEFDAHHPHPHLAEDSDESETEWEGWLDIAIAQRRREQSVLSRRIQRTDTLETAVPGDPYWSAGNEWDVDRTGSPSPAFTTPEHERPDPWAHVRSREPSGSDAEVDTATDGDESSAHSGDPAPGASARPSSYYGYLHWQPVPSSRGRRVKRGTAALDHGGRTLSSYSSVDSLLKRTMRSAIGGSTKAQAKRASVSSAELRLHQGQGAAEAPPPRSSSASPPLSRTSMASQRSTGSARSHPLSPLCAPVQDSVPAATGRSDSEQTPRRHPHQPQQQQHPIPLPGMPMVPSGYTTFRHSALYGRRAAARGSSSSPTTRTPGAGAGAERESEERAHAGLAHGQSMQRMPVPMSMMMTTVSSTVSVGPAKPGAASR
ncbi:hypothetical protein TRAPUB_5656 [Trametes pubescens]|uniref:Uncharacterized protein n=1 Tax=Trametes pubescens TaxID=154538 RepID=A0A1M2V7Q1_TRAPU|nr:hypothetical protein TRAPUB_5656 [Trametes pubescens]